MASKEEELELLNKVLTALRQAADADGWLEGSMTEVVVGHPSLAGRPAGQLTGAITALGNLGWQHREAGKQGHRIRLSPERITSLNVLPDVVAQRLETARLGQATVQWLKRPANVTGLWVVYPPDTSQPMAVRIVNSSSCGPGRDPIRHRVHLEFPGQRQEWFDALMLTDTTMGASVFYSLIELGNAKHAQTE